MAVVKVIKKQSEIDGRPIEWNVLSITSYLGGDFQTLEVKLDRTQAMLAGMLLASDEKKGEVTTSKGGEVNVTVKKGKKDSDNDPLDFLDE